MSESEELRRDLARVTDALLTAVRSLTRLRSEELYQRLEHAATQLRAGELPGDRRTFANEIEALGEDELETMARANALECHLMNTAEERERLRALRARGDEPRDGVAAAIDALIAAGFREREFRAFFDRALVMPVITAHPTESRSRRREQQEPDLDHRAVPSRRLGERRAHRLRGRPRREALATRSRAHVDGQHTRGLLAGSRRADLTTR